ncbi:MAG: flippase-like domain-containing protein, partial [Actinobacteria bacterium]|nr:flippase-like domain-containing protein [Actinomycetota bacterium]
GLPPLALGVLAFTEDVGSALVIAAAVGMVFLVGMIVGFALVLRSKRLDRVVGDWLGRLVSWVTGRFGRAPVTTWGAAAVRFRITTNDLLAAGWKRLTVTTVVSHLSLYLVLLAALRSAGVSEADVSWVRVLAAFAFVRLISALPITPGGLGVVELGYTAALAIGLDDPTKAKIVAAVLVFRFITYFLPIPLGAASYLYWRSNRSWRAAAAEGAPAGE